MITTVWDQHTKPWLLQWTKTWFNKNWKVTHLLAFPFSYLAGHLRQHTCSLLSTHYWDAGIGPHVQKSWAICPTTHAIVPCPKWASHDQSQFWNLCACYSSHHLGSMLCDTTCFCITPHHEACRNDSVTKLNVIIILTNITAIFAVSDYISWPFIIQKLNDWSSPVQKCYTITSSTFNV